MLEDKFNQAYCIFILVTLLVPFQVAPRSLSYSSNAGWSVSVFLFSVLWVYAVPSLGNSGGLVFDYEYWSVAPIFIFPSIVFAFLVLLCVKGRISKRYTVLGGIFSLIWPGGFMLLVELQLLLGGALVYVGPVPIQFLFGLILLRYYGPKEEESFPLEGDDSSWWNESNGSGEGTSSRTHLRMRR